MFKNRPKKPWGRWTSCISQFRKHVEKDFRLPLGTWARVESAGGARAMLESGRWTKIAERGEEGRGCSQCSVSYTTSSPRITFASPIPPSPFHLEKLFIPHYHLTPFLTSELALCVCNVWFLYMTLKINHFLVFVSLHGRLYTYRNLSPWN